ncbi:MAG: branched-chain amino acid ABC transporter permease [Deltaproteobacteria bacterium]|nr:branched-chain amino acid ABC transporter permease [Deltaproteobacteria bacterium]MBW2016648.1 branched-chain amino acid ABC transporter permease [Deltaproteobacteria bacterium]MBW2128820.1 branched-chain amino acid ABC transporter permease [Deltaproteobacteria bacterium]MBW2303756.1 branched-chain amino acid ABC transporter permease [Deltaproteobacteria bacterium]
MIIDQIINGLTIGGIYALIALGYTLVYGILFMINFAHGEIFMFGSFGGYVVLMYFANSGFASNHPILAVIIAFLGAMLVSSVLGALLERIAYRPLRKAPRLAPLISAIGASIFLQNVMMLIIKGRMQIYPDIIPEEFLEIGPATISYFQIFIIFSSFLLMAGLYIFIQKTKIGKAMRAVAENKDAASLMGIDVDRIILITFVLGSALAAAAGVMVGMYYTQINHMMGFIPGIKAFTAAVLGGIGNVVGAMLGGFFLGMVEAMGVLVMPSEYKDVIAFSLLVLVLIFRPRGILGEVVSERA